MNHPITIQLSELYSIKKLEFENAVKDHGSHLKVNKLSSELKVLQLKLNDQLVRTATP
jgi:hypothetical protein